MAAHVVLHLGGRDLLHIQIGVDHGFLIPDAFADQVAERIDDAAAASAENVRPVVQRMNFIQILRVGCLGDQQVCVDEVAVAFDGDVPDGVLPLRVVIRICGDVQRNTLFIKRHTGRGM